MQFVGARDLATWMLDLCERDAGGTFNDCPPAGQWTMGGGSGCVEPANVVRDLVARTERGFAPLYEWSDTIEHKMPMSSRFDPSDGGEVMFSKP